MADWLIRSPVVNRILVNIRSFFLKTSVEIPIFAPPVHPARTRSSVGSHAEYNSWKYPPCPVMPSLTTIREHHSIYRKPNENSHLSIILFIFCNRGSHLRTDRRITVHSIMGLVEVEVPGLGDDLPHAGGHLLGQGPGGRISGQVANLVRI